MDLETALQQSYASSVIDFPETAVDNANVTNVAGGKKLSFNLKGEAMNEILTETMSSMESVLSASGELEALDLQFSDIYCECIVDNDNMMKSYRMVFTMTMNEPETNETVTIEYDLECVVNGINNVTIDFPEDLDTYMEMPMVQPIS